MREFKALLCALALAACGGGDGDGDGGDNGQVSDELAEYCIATFTADHEILNVVGDVALRVEQGQRYLLTGLRSSPKIVYQHPDGSFDLELADGAPVESPCLAEGATLSSESVAFARIEVYSDQALQNRVCTIEKFARSSSAGLGFGYGYVGDNVYQVYSTSGFCDGVDSGFVRATSVSVGNDNYTRVPVEELFLLQE